MSRDHRVDPDDENVLVVAGDVTSIDDSANTGQAVAAGGDSIAVSLTPDGALLNVAFVTASGGVQILQIAVGDLVHPAGAASAGDGVVSAELTALSSDVISAGEGAATSVGTIMAAADLDGEGNLSLSFSDGDGHLQLIETNVAELLRSRRATDEDTTA